ncbi:unnamed protein product [Brassica rapa]|uniref:Uncharacterized protein n=1 Tax=Brassica campestris TaxID=3711 RepID=A0A8D9G5K8_BRACM|nr:unnamed protein product [Brassica rapa]
MITVLSGRLKRKMNLDKKEEPTNVLPVWRSKLQKLF